MIDYFEPFSRYIIASLSSSLYSPYQRSIAAKPQIESCNYPVCHLIASPFISFITPGPANSSQGQRESKGPLVAQHATDSSSLWYIYSSSWVQSKLMHESNFFPSIPFPSTPQRLLSLSPFLVFRSLCESWIEAAPQTKVIQSSWTCGSTVTCYLGFHSVPSSFRARDKKSTGWLDHPQHCTQQQKHLNKSLQ